MGLYRVSLYVQTPTIHGYVLREVNASDEEEAVAKVKRIALSQSIPVEGAQTEVMEILPS